MIKPSDLKPETKLNPRVLKEIEEHIDTALRGAAGWPLVIDVPRAGWSVDEIRSVLDSYRANGWAVLADDRRRALCAIMPASEGPANVQDAELELALHPRRYLIEAILQLHRTGLGVTLA